tara:strand:+ start:99 stop:686 length:588 start_codon:yes stop_codon:yes gene_type:complete
VKEGLFKILPIVFFFNICFLQDNVDDTQFINLNYSQYQKNNTIIGFNLTNSSTSNISLSVQNWFTDNLYLLGILYPNKKSNNLHLSYSLNLGYAVYIDNSLMKNIIFNFGYNKKQFDLNDFKNISIGQIMFINLEKINIGISYNFIDADLYNFQQFGIDFFKKINNIYIVKLGTKLDYGNKEYINTLYFTFNYCI